MKHADGSNSVSTPRAPQQTEKIVEVPKSQLKQWGDKCFILRNQKLYPVTKTKDGLYKAKSYDVRWLVRVV